MTEQGQGQTAGAGAPDPATRGPDRGGPRHARGAAARGADRDQPPLRAAARPRGPVVVVRVPHGPGTPARPEHRGVGRPARPRPEPRGAVPGRRLAHGLRFPGPGAHRHVLRARVPRARHPAPPRAAAGRPRRARGPGGERPRGGGLAAGARGHRALAGRGQRPEVALPRPRRPRPPAPAAGLRRRLLAPCPAALGPRRLHPAVLGAAPPAARGAGGGARPGHARPAAGHPAALGPGRPGPRPGRRRGARDPRGVRPGRRPDARRLHVVAGRGLGPGPPAAGAVGRLLVHRHGGDPRPRARDDLGDRDRGAERAPDGDLRRRTAARRPPLGTAPRGAPQPRCLAVAVAARRCAQAPGPCPRVGAGARAASGRTGPHQGPPRPDLAGRRRHTHPRHRRRRCGPGPLLHRRGRAGPGSRRGLAGAGHRGGRRPRRVVGGPSGSTAGWTAPPPRSAPAGAAGGPSRCARATAAAAGRWSGPRSSTR